MAHSQMNDTVKRAGVCDPVKNRNTAARTLKFGIHLISDGDIRFEPVGDTSASEIGELFRELDAAHENSPLPDEVDPESFERFLYDLRISEITGAM